MNSATEHQPPASVPNIQDGDTIQVGIHISFPRNPQAEAVGLTQPLLLLTLAAGLSAMLRREGLLNESVGFSGDGCDGFLAFETNQRETALQIVKGYFAEGVSPYYGWATIAWLDQAEGAWRIIQHGHDQRPFEDRVSEKAHGLRRAITERAVQLLASLQTPSNQTSP